MLKFDLEDLMSNHAYATPYIVDGRKMHGGFDAQGRYVTPRSLVRQPALEAWAQALLQRGGEMFDADAALLSGDRVPNLAQQRFLFAHGVYDLFGAQLTQLATLEARAGKLADWKVPNLQSVIKQDISCMAIGHLGKGLLLAHGLDESGSAYEGGHAELWLKARDLALSGLCSRELREVAVSPRPSPTVRHLPELPFGFEPLLFYLMNTFIHELRALVVFSDIQCLLNDLCIDFPSRAKQLKQSSDIVERICQDEQPHLLSLRLYFSEIGGVTFKTIGAGELPGRLVIERLWAVMLDAYLSERLPEANQAQEQVILQLLEHRSGGQDLGAKCLALGGHCKA
jgi:hypothetical protein